jgi:hypothetical protein
VVVRGDHVGGLAEREPLTGDDVRQVAHPRPDTVELPEQADRLGRTGCVVPCRLVDRMGNARVARDADTVPRHAVSWRWGRRNHLKLP